MCICKCEQITCKLDVTPSSHVTFVACKTSSFDGFIKYIFLHLPSSSHLPHEHSCHDGGHEQVAQAKRDVIGGRADEIVGTGLLDKCRTVVCGDRVDAAAPAKREKPWRVDRVDVQVEVVNICPALAWQSNDADFLVDDLAERFETLQRIFVPHLDDAR